MKVKFLTGVSGLVLSTLFSASAMAQTAQSGDSNQSETAQTAKGDDSSGSDEIVVTAQRREESLQKVPISISVLDGEALDKATYTSVIDALRDVPAITFFSNPQSGMTYISVRGVASNPSLFDGSAVIGYYLDEIPFSFARFPVTPDAGAYDLKRVEVLRGPQGTLYGAGSLNGVVRVLTEDANLDRTELKYRSTISSTDGGGENYRADGAVSVPLVPGKLAVRIVGGYSNFDGWIDQPPTGRKNINGAEQWTIRGKINATPTDNLRLGLMAWVQRDRRGGYDAANVDDEGNQTLDTAISEPIKNDLDAFNFTINNDFNAFSVLSSTSYLKFRNEGVLNIPQGTDGALITRMIGKLFAQEVRLNSRAEGPWKWTLGGIYRKGNDLQKSDFPTGVLAPLFPTFFTNRYKSDSWAVFGEISRLLLDDRLELTGGLRYFEDKSTSIEIDTGSSATVAPFGTRRDKFSSLTPRFVASYHVSDDLSLYATYGQGFRSGFAQNGTVLRNFASVPGVEPDKLTNYEVGMKGRAIGRRLSYDIAAYHIDWKDIINVYPVTYNGVGFFAAVNGGRVSGNGLDASVNMNVTDRLSVGVLGGWNNLSYDRDVIDGNGDIVIPEGRRAANTPKLTAGARLSYEMPLGNDYSGRFAANVDHTSKMIRTVPDPAFFSGGAITRVRANYSVISPNGWSIMAFVDNLTNENDGINPTYVPFQPNIRLRPRTFGLQFDYKY